MVERGDHIEEIRQNGRAGDVVKVDDRQVEQLETIAPERDETKWCGEANLDIGLKEGLQRSLEVENALGAREQVTHELIEVHAAIAVVVLEVRAEDALHAPSHAGLGHNHVQLRTCADRGGERHLRRVVARGHVVVEVDAVEQFGAVKCVARHCLTEAKCIVADREVGGEPDAAEDRGKQRREDRETLAHFEAGVQRWQMPTHERRVASEQEFEKLPVGMLYDRKLERTLRAIRDVGVRL